MYKSLSMMVTFINTVQPPLNSCLRVILPFCYDINVIVFNSRYYMFHFTLVLATMMYIEFFISCSYVTYCYLSAGIKRVCLFVCLNIYEHSTSSAVAYVIPWVFFVNQGCYIPKCSSWRVSFENGCCEFFPKVWRSRSKVKGQLNKNIKIDGAWPF